MTGSATGTSSSTGSGSGATTGTTTGGTGTTGTSTGGTNDAGCGCDAGTYCDPADSGMCLECLTDANCTAPKPVCQTLSGTISYGKCVSCTQAEPACSGALLCEVDAGTCVECLEPTDCPYSLPGCFHLTNSCGYCIDDADCPSGLSCNTRIRKCVCSGSAQCGGNAPVCIVPTGPAGEDGGYCGCQTTPDCASQGGDVCVKTQQSPQGICIPSCVDGGTDCSTNASPNQFCNVDAGVCGPCTADEQCGGNDAGPICLPFRGICGCNTSTDCPPTAGCGAGAQCSPACTIDGGPDCAAMQMICDPATRVCVACLTDQDCGTSAPYCTSDIDAGNTCAQCVNPSQCPAGMPGCNSFRFMCGSCSASADCPASAPVCQNFACGPSCVLSDGGTYCAIGVCQLSTGMCVNCLQDADCQGQAGRPFCSNDVDAGTRCVQCLQASDCADAGYCNSRFLSCGSCAANADCPPEAPSCSNPPFGTCTDAGL